MAADADPEGLLQELAQLLATRNETLEVVSHGIDMLWTCELAFLAFSTMGGFMLIESASTSRHNPLSAAIKVIGGSSLAILFWWATGFAISHGVEGVGREGSVLGTHDFFLASHRPLGKDALPGFMLTALYACTTGTILSGAVAERIALTGYFILLALMTALVFPVLAHWLWAADGWLSVRADGPLGCGVLDYAGGAVVHVFGGTVAIVAAWWLGPRLTKADSTAHRARDPFQFIIGTFMLWFSWLPFVASGAGSIVDREEANINAVVVALTSSGSAMLMELAMQTDLKKPIDIVRLSNSVLAGLTASMAGAGYVAPLFGPVLGGVAAVACRAFSHLRKRLGIDDPVDAGAVHFAGGAWGTLAVGLFADTARVAGATPNPGGTH
eukprot:Hpha_TRINITY_DN15870_c3_g2::TRINITY_DN15870_c3_g2_i1::g.187397::m.187397/K03320/amt, AMT, MEP; ammonium transporter, Amt family